jgi:hypothetical protein
MGPHRTGARELTLKIKQVSTQIRPEYWKWSAWIEGTEKELDGIQQVKWILHPTFVNPVRASKSRSTKFLLETAGWGEFQLKGEVTPKVGKVKQLSRWVKLERTLSVAATEHIASFADDKISPSRRSAFVSYTRDSGKLMRDITEALHNRGIEPTIDADVPTGLELKRWITEEIHASDAVLVLISHDIDIWQRSEIESRVKTEKPLFLIATETLKNGTKELIEQYKGPNIHLIYFYMERNVQELADKVQSFLQAGGSTGKTAQP